MSKVLQNRLTRALATVAPNGHLAVEAGPPGRADMFGQERPGRTWEDLRWTVGPCTDNPRRVKEVDGKRVDAGPAEQWTVDEVWAAIKRIVMKIARKYTSGGWAKGKDFDEHAFDDAVQNAAMQATMVIARGDDQARIGNAFTTWLKGHIQTAIRGGVTVQGAEFKAARGLLGLLGKAKDTQDVVNHIMRIKPQDRRQHDKLYRRDNEFGTFAPKLYQLGQELYEAMVSEEPDLIRQAKRHIKMEWDKMGEEAEHFPGAASGLHDLWKRPHSGVGHEKARELKRQSMQVKSSETGEMVERDLPSQSEDETEVAANREVIRHFLDVARYGYKGPEGEIQPLGYNKQTGVTDPKKFRVLIRYAGVADYPDRGDPERDPEWNQDVHDQALQQMKEHGSIEVRPASVDEAVRLGELAGASKEEIEEIVAATSERDQEYDVWDTSKDTGPGAGQDNRADIRIEVEPGNEKQMEEIANIVGYSPWVRQGCPAMTNKAIRAWLKLSNVRVTQFLRELGFIHRPEAPGFLRRMGRMIGPRLTGEVPDEDDEGGVAEEARQRGGDLITEALIAGWEASEIFRKRVLLTEAQNDPAGKLVLEACRWFRRRLIARLESLSRSDL